jgi:trk system potassium uptake protein TrkA
MRITIVGGGKVGTYLAHQLTHEGHDITVVDTDEQVLEQLGNTMDIITCVGNGASYAVLKSVGIDTCDLLIAVTLTDEVNMLCCLAAHRLGAKHTIARVRNPEYASQLVDMKDDLGLSMSINPERAVAEEVARILRFPSATHVELFARGRVELVSCRVTKDSVFDQLKLSNLPHALGAKVLICAVDRGGQVTIPSGDFVLQQGDDLYLTGAPAEIETTFRKANLLVNRIRSVMLAGGSRIAYYLTSALSKENISVKIVENSRERATELAAMLPKATILWGDVADHELLNEEGLGQQDAFVALTGLDEGNILSALYASRLHVPKVIAKVNNENLVELVKNNGLQSVITPKLVIANLILCYVRALAARKPGGNALSLYKLVGGRAEVLEFRATQEDREMTGIPLAQLQTKKDILIACLVRNGKVIIPCGADSILPGDGVLVATACQRLNELSDIMEA